MSELIDKLTAAAQQHKGTDLGGLLQWAILHIQSQDEALAETREELASEEAERLRLEAVLHHGRAAIDRALETLKAAQPVIVTLARDHASHINVMAHHGVAPYAKKSRKSQPATA